MPKGKGYPGSKKTSGGGTNTQMAAGTPGLTPGGAGPGGTSKTYSGQPSSTGETSHMGDVATPNQMQEPQANKMFPK